MRNALGAGAAEWMRLRLSRAAATDRGRGSNPRASTQMRGVAVLVLVLMLAGCKSAHPDAGRTFIACDQFGACWVLRHSITNADDVYVIGTLSR